MAVVAAIALSSMPYVAHAAPSVTLSPTCGPAAPASTTVTARAAGFTTAGLTGGPAILFEVLDASGAFVFRDAHKALASGGFTALFGISQPSGTYTVRLTQDDGGNRTADAGEPTASATFTVPCPDGSGGDPAPPARDAVLYALMTSFSTAASALEIVSLSNMQLVKTISLGDRDVDSLAVSADGGRAYVADATNGAVAVIDVASGGQVASLAALAPRDIVLAPGGGILYVTTNTRLMAFDTATNAMLRELSATAIDLKSDKFLSVAVSPNGSTIATLGHDGSTIWVYLVRASDFTLLKRFALTNPGEPSNCATDPNDVAFASDATLLLWDSNCDNLYEVDVATQTQNTAATIRLGRDDGSSGNYNNALSYSSATNSAYVHTEGIGVGGDLRGHIGIFDRAAAASSSVFGLVETPFSSALTPDGRSLFVDVIRRFVTTGTADRLDRFDTVTKTYHRGVYTFSESGKSARDMKIVHWPVATFVVNSTADTDVCDATTCTLRGAINAANASANSPLGPDVIAFNIGGPAPFVIGVATQLPSITDAVVIDGQTQPGFFDGSGPVITINGGGIPLPEPGASNDGLRVFATGSHVNGLRIANFAGPGILLANLFGPPATLITNNALVGNGNGLQAFNVKQAQISFNVISANLGYGMYLGSTSELSIFGNKIGVTLSGDPAGNGNSGVILIHDGGSTASTVNALVNNTIAFNGEEGVQIGPNSSGNLLLSNQIRQNGSDGTEIVGTGSTANSIQAGSITAHSGKAIHLAGGANGGIQPPTIGEVFITGGGAGLVVAGTASPGAVVSIYADPDGEAEIFLGETTADGQGQWAKPSEWTLMDLTAITSSLRAGTLKLHATQRDALGNTSELSGGAGPSGIVIVARCGPDGPVLTGITAQLVQDGVVLATTTTTADGLAIFVGAQPGSYSVILIKADGSQCVITATLEADGDQVIAAPAPCATSNSTWLTAQALTANGVPTTGALCAGGHLWYRIVMPDGSTIVPQLSRIVARLTGVGGGELPADFTLMLAKDPLLALQPVSTPTDAHVQFAGDTFGGDTFGGDTFGGDTFGGDTFGGDTFGGDTFGGDTFGGDTFGGDTFGGDTFGGDTFGGDTFGGDTFGGDTFGGDTFGGDTFGGDTFGGDTFGGVFKLAGGDPRAYAAAISRSIVRVAAHGGTSPEGLWQNTWNNANSWYLRVSSARGSGPFQLSAQVFTGQCGGVDPALGVSSLAVPTTGTYETLILRNSAREGGANSAANLTSLQSLAAHATVNGYIADFAGDMATAYGQLGMNAFCPNAANAVVDGIRGYVRSFKAAHPELKWIVIAANDEGVPGYRVQDLSTLAPQSMLVLPLQPQMVEGVLRLNYFATDDAYGDWDPVQKRDHLLFIPEVAVGRIDPAYVPTLVSTYIAANGVLTPSTAAVTGYNFWNDSATSIRDQLAATGKPVNQFATAHPLIQAAQGLPTDANAWDVNDLVDAFEADTDIFVLFAHGLRASKIAPANYLPDLTAGQAIAIGDTSPQIKRLKLLISGACNFALGIPAGQTIPGLSPDPELAEIGQAFGWTTVAWDSYAYGDDERIAYSEELADDLIRELRYGTGQVVLGDALVRVKRAWASRQTDLQGLHQKSLMGMVILGMPMLRVDLGSAGRLTRPSDLADFTSAGLSPVPAGTAGSNAALGLRTRDITIDFTAPAHKLTKFDVPLQNINAAGNATGSTTVTSYWAVTTPSEPRGFVQLNPGEQILPRWSVPLHPSDLAADSATFARGATLVQASCTRTTPFTPLISRAAYQLTPAAGPFITDRYLPNDWWEINYLDPTREFLLVRPAQLLSAINATTGAPEAFGTSKTFTNVTFRAWYSSLLAQTITDANGATMQAILAGPPEFLARTATPSSDGSAIDFDVRVSVLPNLGVQSVAVLWQDTDPTAACAINSFELTQDVANGQRWTGTLTLPTGVSAPDVTYALQAVSGAGRVRVADNFGAWYPAQAAPTLAMPLADTALAFVSPPATAVSGRKVTVSAELRRTDTNATVSGRRLDFRLSGVNGDSAFGYTNASGVAQAALDVDALPGTLSVWVELRDGDGLRGSSKSSPLTVQKETTSFSLLTATPSTQQDSDVVQVSARLADGLGRRLREQGVLFLVTSAACATYLATDPACFVIQAQGAETDFRGDARASFALATGAGAFRAHAHFAGTTVVPSGLASPPTITLDLQNARYVPATAGTDLTVTAEEVTVAYTGDTVKATGQPISLGGTFTEYADGSLGMIPTGGTLATFEISDTNGVLVATVFGTITRTGPGTANVSGTLPTGLTTGVYSVVLRASGDRSGQSPVVFLAVYDPSAGFVTGGGWLDPEDGTVAGFSPSGKLSFSFSFKYRNGAPVGDLQARQQGGVSVEGATADWLVIVGSTAEFEGLATVDGVAGYRYRMSVTDGPDGAWLRVWDAATGSVSSPLYDARRTPIDKGSIVIHQ